MTEINNPALKAMIALGKKQKEMQEKESQSIPIINIPPVKQEETKKEVLAQEPQLLSLSLDLEEDITKELIMENVKILPRELKGDPEKYKKAKRKVTRLTTGATAALPIICKGMSCPFKEKCVTGDTLIFTPEGMKKISSIKKGDEVYSVDVHGRIEHDKVVGKVKTGKKKVYRVKTSYGLSIKVTEEHRFLTYSSGFRTYRSLKSGIGVGSIVYILDADLELNIDSNAYGDLYEDTIVEITELKEEDVYDITVRMNANFIGNNILVHNCTYYNLDIHEEGENCLEEEQLIEHWTKFYMEDLQINPKSISELHILSRLVEITILDLRMTKYLSINNPDLMMDFVTAADLNDTPLTQKGISVAFEVKDRLEKQKMKLLESLNSTRERKVKVALDTMSTQSRVNSRERLEDRLRELANSIRSKPKNVVIDIE